MRLIAYTSALPAVLAALVLASAMPAPSRAADSSASSGTWPVPAAAGPGAAADPGDALVRLALADGIHARAARAVLEALRHESRQARGWPNPELAFESEDIPGEAFSPGAGDASVGIRQRLPLGPSRFRASLAARLEENAAARRAEAALREIEERVRAAHVELVYRREALSLARGQERIAGSARDAAGARFEAGAAPEAEALRAEVQASLAGASRREAEAEMAAAEAALREAVGVPAIPADRLAGGALRVPDAVDAARLERCLLAENPELLAARADSAASRARAGAERWALLPEPELRFSRGRFGESGEKFYAGEVSFDLPLFDRRGDARRAALARRDLGAAEARIGESRLLSDLRSSLARFDALREAGRDLEARVLPIARRSFEQAETGYREGKFDLLTLLEARRAYGETEAEALRVKRDALIVHAHLRSLAGADCAGLDTRKGNER